MDKMTVKECIRDLKRFLFGSKLRILFTVWLIVIMLVCIVWLFGGKVNDKVVGISAFFSGLSTFAFWCCRKRVKVRVEKWNVSPRTKFILIGSLGAVWVEFVFWLFEKAFGTVGVAANPNFLIDLLVTMPWYVLMIVLLWKVETTNRYRLGELVLFGGIYELGADGLIGSFIGGTFSFAALPLVLFMIPMLVVVYSFMLLPCSYLLKDDIDRVRENTMARSKVNKYVYTLLPLLGLIPYVVLGILIFVF